jgi:hypothetical protein
MGFLEIQLRITLLIQIWCYTGHGLDVNRIIDQISKIPSDSMDHHMSNRANCVNCDVSRMTKRSNNSDIQLVKKILFIDYSILNTLFFLAMFSKNDIF